MKDQLLGHSVIENAIHESCREKEALSYPDMNFINSLVDYTGVQQGITVKISSLWCSTVLTFTNRVVRWEQAQFRRQ